ncbi:MAG TPA: KpsF/GutQ family sugar-phosphate isomerase [Bryobacterales bacterium]|nr:KpsF/GutQ family sugar-phosphate isomerase [Bryobacterales bacterium]
MAVPSPKSFWLDAARSAMETESGAILSASTRLDGTLLQAVDLMLAEPGKVVVTGVGKSGVVGRNIAATLLSTGTQAVFLHPVEAAHGDLGIYTPGDVTLMVSKSGTTSELMRLLPTLREFESKLIGIIGNPASPLAAKMDVVLDASVEREADPHNLVPTASSVVALALGHALAVALMTARGFSSEDFGGYHPGGQLGRSLRTKVSDGMHPATEIAIVQPDDLLKQVVIAMTRHPFGAACVLDEQQCLAGLITDGDLRRALREHDDIRLLRASEVMTANPVTIGPDARLFEALRIMEDRPSQIHVIPVVGENGTCLGLLRLHDICQVWVP